MGGIFLQVPNIPEVVFLFPSYGRHNLSQQVLHILLLCFLAKNWPEIVAKNSNINLLFAHLSELGFFLSYQDACRIISFSLKSNFLNFLSFLNPEILFFIFSFISSTPFILDSFSRMPINHEVNFCFLLLIAVIFFDTVLIPLSLSSAF